MKVCTYNVNSVRARLELLLKWLDKRGNDLDLLCLQELKAAEKDFPLEQFASLGYEVAVFGQPQYNGVAVCSKKRIAGIRKGLGEPSWDDQKRVISCKTAGITVINVYMPHGDDRGEEKYHYKLEWFSQFRKYLDLYYHPEEALLLVGDFNVALEDRDVYDAGLLRDSVCTMPEERQALGQIIDWGFVDTYRYLQAEKGGYTWWSYLGGGIWKDEGMRIDYVFCTGSLKEKLVNVAVDLWPRRRRKPTPSDHAPVIAEFKD